MAKVHKPADQPPVEYEQSDVSTTIYLKNCKTCLLCPAQRWQQTGDPAVGPIIRLLTEQPLAVLKSPYQPAVEYEQTDVSTILQFFFFIFETINIMKSAVSFLIKEKLIKCNTVKILPQRASISDRLQ
ncbi:hypothetical protein T10_5738 [Trichinella papuae]|uniref:Uncharacterized protein n=1 Tax=Trichinella papuae TaxID=268474 RepID=A0A0V1MNT1_9BILA|nr:hypothetical protein T10_5738 [Trichinella papuae]